MRRKSGMLLERAKNSLILAVDFFNRPYDVGRKEASIIMLHHSFEMLLKAVVFEKLQRIRNPKEDKNYSFDKCLNLCFNHLQLLDERAARTLSQVNGFRDAAMHDVLDVPEGLLYYYAQQSLFVFAALLKQVFKKELYDILPDRLLPVSTNPPEDIAVIFDREFTAMRRLLTTGKRKHEAVEAKLRVYRVIEANMKPQEGELAVDSTETLIKKLKRGDSWHDLFPNMAAAQVGEGQGPLLAISIGTGKDAIPVRIDKEAAEATIAVRKVSTEVTHPLIATDVWEELNINSYHFQMLIKLFNIKGNSSFHTTVRVSRRTSEPNHKYSRELVAVLRKAVDKYTLAFLVAEAKAGQKRDVREFL